MLILELIGVQKWEVQKLGWWCLVYSYFQNNYSKNNMQNQNATHQNSFQDRLGLEYIDLCEICWFLVNLLILELIGAQTWEVQKLGVWCLVYSYFQKNYSKTSMQNQSATHRNSSQDRFGLEYIDFCEICVWGES